MIPADLLKGVEAVAGMRPLAGGRHSAFRLLPQADPGEIFSARVEAELPDGSFKVVLGGQAMSMSLPARVAVGDKLSLTFVAREPRLTFALNEPLQEGTQPAPQLSPTGRLVAATMLRPGDLPLPLPASASAPLLAAPPGNGYVLSQALQDTFAQSGLFYESHLAQWIAGERDLAQILLEPQARLAQALTEGDARAVIAHAETAWPDATHAHHQGASIDPRTVPLVQQQLSALDSSRILLQVELWPGQWTRWEIDEDHTGGDGSGEQPTHSWTTRLMLDLPRLGRMNAVMTLSEDALHVRLASPNTASAALCRERGPDLHLALSAAGLPPADIAVSHDERA